MIDSNAPAPLILSTNELSESPPLFAESSLGEDLRRANDAAAVSARARVSAALSIDLAASGDDHKAEAVEAVEAADAAGGAAPGATAKADEATSGRSPQLGVLGGWEPPSDIMALAQQVVAGATGSGRTAARLVFPEGAAPLSPDVDAIETTSGRVEGSGSSDEDPEVPRVDLRRPAHILRRLDDGWTLEADEPLGLAPELCHLIGDLETAFGPISVTFSLGLRSALGAAPSANPGGRLYVQLAGARSLLVRSESDQQQFGVSAGQVAWVPAGWVTNHLPLDADSAHLTIAFAQPPAAETADVTSWSDQTDADRAMRPARASYDMTGARGFFAADPDSGWMLRWAASAGAFAGSETSNQTDGASTIVAGSIALELSADGVRLVEALAAGDWTSHSLAAVATNLDPVAISIALEELAAVGLVTVAPARRNERANAFLNGVARGVSMPKELLSELIATIDDAKWRPPTPAEVRGADVANIEVQSLARAGYQLASEVLRAVAMLNAQFFGADITGLHDGDPPLLVRVRSSGSVGNETASPINPLEFLGSDIDGENTTRKLTWVLSLSDADGSAQDGWFVMPGGSDKVEPTPGEVSVFPSFRLWTLAPMAAGERLLLLGRLHGPAFR